MNDNLGKMLNQIKNASLIKHEIILMPYTLNNYLILKVLKDEGFFESISVITKKTTSLNNRKNFRYIKVYLKYYGQNKKSVINNISRLSKPSLRVYAKYKNIPNVLNGLGTTIISTSKGIMTNKDASANKIGGELLFSIW